MADSSALNAQIIRGLNDRVYEKRKAAALEVEKLIREYITNKEPDKIKAILNKLVSDFACSQQANSRNGGLIGLAAASIALGPNVAAYLDEIVPPVLACFADQDSRVRYYACESMYNIAKVSKGEILRYFNEVFDAMSKLAADSEVSVKNGTELLDRLIKDIVAEQSTTYVSALVLASMSQDDSTEPVSMPRTTAFSLPRFIPLLAERIHAKNPFTRNFLVSWITVLDSIPDLELVSFLPDFLDGLLRFLSDPNKDIRNATSSILANFLAEIREAFEVKEHQKQQAMKSYFVEQQRKMVVSSENASDAGESVKDESTKGDSDDITLGPNSTDGVISWDAISISETEGRGKGSWVPGQGVIINYDRIVQIFMDHLCSSEEEIQATALKWINEFIHIAKEVIISFTPQLISAIILETPTNYMPSPQPPPYSLAILPSAPNGSAYPANSLPSIDEQADPFDYQATVESLVRQFSNVHEETRVASLDWLLMLHKKSPKKILAIDDGTFSVLLKILSDPCEEVVKRDLQLLAQLSSSFEDENFKRFMGDLLKSFSTDRKLLESRGSLIIRNLCVSLDSERIYCSFAEILEKEEDIEFASSMVQNLNSILITSPELSDLRKRLKSLETRDGQTADLDITVNLLIQIDKLVQLLESPVFTYLRLQLLEPDKYPYLFKCLYGLLMLLPQSSAFASLKNRLTSVSSMGFLHLIPRSAPQIDIKRGTSKSYAKDDGIKFHDLLNHFRTVQAKHEKTRKQAQNSGSISQPTRSRRIRGDRTSLPASSSNLSQSATSISNKNNSGSTDQRGGANVNVNTGTSGSLQADQSRRRLSAASSTSATSDHGSGSVYSRSQSPPVSVKRGTLIKK
ncbi:17009_t:CDS:10 [Cetraspora pellucida]|uniref:17009_t:CDS:1 n=1 Tax=Cetraspora pellucida TaxID=1433469 RepID=A0A9N9EMM8_9GLOM|nr:17009_t:CDS:10 [Cetraspora pellucida]